ncbi:MAG: hypothetical protein K9J16_02235 [Melioribacteraceae bacterium]|nr:hypothetical protein [Melioribacteraceae bacterium]MCF8355146.1 hypothetical protein [Melioribacteraceae bacterium]MCF8392475.1 hypothetical protein [Melioribacteraceae bacterium]MCF8418386.1 hypothetical protein [Melioribacteraceae bacterium]
MRIKKYKAKTLADAMNKMKQDLGNQAVLLSSNVIPEEQRIDDNIFEVTAAIDNGSNGSGKSVSIKEDHAAAASFENELSNLTKKVYNQKKYDDLKPEPAIENDKAAKSLNDIRDTLLGHEIENEVVDTIIKHFSEYNNTMKSKSSEKYISSIIASLIPTKDFEVENRKSAKTICLIGPTGVGKTTSVAKLAVISKLLHHLDVGIISIDTHRLGALDQLRIFSEISNIDFQVAYEPDDLVKLTTKFKKKDLIIIDTVGRSQNDKKHLDEIKSFLGHVKIDETFLVLNTTSSSRTLKDVASKFSYLGYDSYIFTKIDEAPSFGNILNLVYELEKPVSFLTNGQVIPDDILAADPDFIAKMIFKGKFTA